MTNYGTIQTTSSENTNTEYISLSKTRRPWKEMVRSFNLPSGFYNTTKRVKTNVNYFRINYAGIMYFIQFLFLVYLLISLVVFVAFMVVWLYIYFVRDEPPVVFRGDLICCWIIMMVLVYLTGNVYWNIMLAVWIGGVVVWDLFVDEQVTQSWDCWYDDLK